MTQQQYVMNRRKRTKLEIEVDEELRKIKPEDIWKHFDESEGLVVILKKKRKK